MEFKSGDWIKLKDNLSTIFRDFEPNQSYRVIYPGVDGRILVEIDSPYTKDKLTHISAKYFELDIQYMRENKINEILKE